MDAVTARYGVSGPIVGTWVSESSTINSGDTSATCTVPYQGYPVRVGVMVTCEFGAVNSGSRFDLNVYINGDLCAIIVTEQFKLRAWRQLTIPPSNTILTSSC